MKRLVACLDHQGQGMCLEQDRPVLAPGQVGVAVHASLISPGTELGGVAGLRQQPAGPRPPRPFGYANAGVVDAVGEGVTQLQLGDRVACMGAGYALHADWVAVPQNLCVRVPLSVATDEATFAHLAATALHAVRRAEPAFGENAMVMGLGLVGQLTAQLAGQCGCHVMAVDRLAVRLAAARNTGVEAVVDATQTDPVAEAARFGRGYGMDWGVIAFGGDANEAFEQIYQSLKLTPDTHRMGRIVVVGGARLEHLWAAGLGNVDVRSAARTGPGYHDETWEHGTEYPGVWVEWTTRRNLEECLGAIGAGRLQVRALITHQVPLSQIGAAVDLLVEQPQTALGVILRP